MQDVIVAGGVVVETRVKVAFTVLVVCTVLRTTDFLVFVTGGRVVVEVVTPEYRVTGIC